MNCADVVEERPALSLSVVLVVAAVAYAVISLAMRGAVDAVETGVFAAVFAAVYVGFASYADSLPCLWCR